MECSRPGGRFWGIFSLSLDLDIRQDVNRHLNISVFREEERGSYAEDRTHGTDERNINSREASLSHRRAVST